VGAQLFYFIDVLEFLAHLPPFEGWKTGSGELMLLYF